MCFVLMRRTDMPRKRKKIIRGGDEKLPKYWVKCEKRKYRPRLRVVKAEKPRKLSDRS